MPTRVHNRVGGEDGLLRKLGGAGRLVNAIDSYFDGSSGRDAASFLFFSGISSQAPDKEEGMVIVTTIRRLLGHNIASSDTNNNPEATAEISAALQDAIQKAIVRRRCLDAVVARQRGTASTITGSTHPNPSALPSDLAPPPANSGASAALNDTSALGATSQGSRNDLTLEWPSLWPYLQSRGWKRIPCFGTSSFKFKRPNCHEPMSQEEAIAYAREEQNPQSQPSASCLTGERQPNNDDVCTRTAIAPVESEEDNYTVDAEAFKKSLNNLDRVTDALLKSKCIQPYDSLHIITRKLVKGHGWKEINGTGLNTFVYVPPCGFKNGICGVDWFDEEELKMYAELRLSWKGNKSYSDRSTRAARYSLPAAPEQDNLSQASKSKKKPAAKKAKRKFGGRPCKDEKVRKLVKAEKGVKAEMGAKHDPDCQLKRCSVELKNRIKDLQGKKEALLRALPYQKDVIKEKQHLIKTVRERASKNLPKPNLPNMANKSAAERRNARLKATVKLHESDLRGLLTLLPAEEDMKKGREHLIKTIREVSEFESMFTT